MNYKNYIFDLDGTLFDTAQDIIECFEYAFNTVLNNTIKLDRTIIGPPLVDTVKKINPFASEEELAQIIRIFKQQYDNSSYPNTVFYKNVLAVLKLLKENNKLLFIATNKRLIPTLRILKQFKIEGYFTEIGTSDSYESCLLTKSEMLAKMIESNLIKDETCIIGDTSSDIKAGIDTKIDTYFVTYGYEAKERLKYQPNYIIDDIIEITK